MTSPAGDIEYEQWVTWKAHKANDSKFHRLEFRHELEFGLTDRLQLGIYLADWEIVDSKSDSGAEYKKSAVELIYSLSDPTADPIGSALYFEAGLGPEIALLEAKLLLQKNFGPISAVYNFTLEAEWEGDDYAEEVGEIKNTIGVVYQVNPSLSFGFEALHEVELADWSDAGDNVFYLGPNVSYRKGDFFAVLSPLFQLSDVESEPDFATRLIFGFNF
ncbi:MAG: hypothetical protein ACR2OZ_07260 [Verrucomicrobiales bacterium]